MTRLSPRRSLRLLPALVLVPASVLATVLRPMHGFAADAPPPAAPPAAPPARPASPADVEVLPDVYVTDSLRTPVRSASPIGPVTALESLQPVGTVSGERLRATAEASLGATLLREPGVTNSGFAPGAGRPVIRGQGGDRVRVLENGVSTLDVAGLSDDHAVPVDPSSIERVEVVRGPATLRYGSNAIGGLVYLDDGRIPEAPVGQVVAGRVGGGWGSADEQRAGFAALRGQTGCFSWQARGFARESEDLDIPGFAKSQRLLDEEGNPSGAGEARDTLPNSYAKAAGGSVGGAYTVDRGFFGASVDWFDTDYGLPNEPDVHIELDRLRLDTRGRWDAPFGGARSIAWAVGYADYEHTEFEGPDAGTIFEQQAIEGRVEVAHAPWGCWEGAIGLQGAYADLSITGDEALLPFAKTTSFAVFVTERRPLSGCLDLELGARAEGTDVDSVGQETFFAPSLSAGLRWHPTSSTVWALSAAYASRAPTASELYADGPHIATETYEVGDPNLDLERSVGVDLSYRTDGPRVSASATVFYQRYLAYIALEPTGVVDVGSGLEIFDYVGHEAEFLGAEAKVVFHVLGDATCGLDVEALADAVRAQDLDLDDPLPRIAPFRVGGAVVWRSPTLSARVDLQHAFEQDRTAAFELPTDAYTRLDASIAYRFGLPCDRGLTLRLTGTNLLDEEIRLHSSFTKDVAPERGRSLEVSVEFDF